VYICIHICIYMYLNTRTCISNRDFVTSPSTDVRMHLIYESASAAGKGVLSKCPTSVPYEVFLCTYVLCIYVFCKLLNLCSYVLCICVYACMNLYIGMYKYVYIYVYVYIYIYMYIYLQIGPFRRMWRALQPFLDIWFRVWVWKSLACCAEGGRLLRSLSKVYW
jgi:hypothetical protein